MKPAIKKAKGNDTSLWLLAVHKQDKWLVFILTF